MLIERGFEAALTQWRRQSVMSWFPVYSCDIIYLHQSLESIYNKTCVQPYYLALGFPLPPLWPPRPPPGPPRPPNAPKISYNIIHDTVGLWVYRTQVHENTLSTGYVGWINHTSCTAATTSTTPSSFPTRPLHLFFHHVNDLIGYT